MANVDVYEVVEELYYEEVDGLLEQNYTELPLEGSVGVPAPATYYIMQASDSVTSARYDWTVPNTPDWAGVNYPGPNAPTNVSIAGSRSS